MSQGLDCGYIPIECGLTIQLSENFSQVGDVAPGRALEGADAVHSHLSQLIQHAQAFAMEVMVHQTATRVRCPGDSLEYRLVPLSPQFRAEQGEC